MTYSKSLVGIWVVGSLAFGWAACGGSQTATTTTPPPAEQPPPPPPPSHSGTYAGNAGTTVTMTTPRAQPARTSEAPAEVVVTDGYAPRPVVAGADAGAMADGSADATAGADSADAGTTGITLSLTDSSGGPPCIIHVAMTDANGTVLPGQSCSVTRGPTTATTEITTGTAAFSGDELTFDFQANLRLAQTRGRRTETQTGTWGYHFVGRRGGAGDGGTADDATAGTSGDAGGAAR